MSVENMLKEYSEITEQALQELMSNTALSGFDNVGEAMRYSLMSGGKRIRPALTFEICRILSGNYLPAVNFACALEMIHTYSLIHDDLPCMDNDDMRRGKPSCHIKHGESTALLAGDGLLTYAFSVAAKSKLPSESIVQAVSVLADFAGFSGMIGGQMIDLATEGQKIGADTLNAMIKGKTCALFRAAAALGCIAAGVYGTDKAEALDDFAVNFGMTFQIVDDILDVVGDSKVLGKNTGSDENNDKSNYVTLFGIDKARLLALQFNEAAKSALSKAGNAERLVELCDYLIKRTA